MSSFSVTEDTWILSDPHFGHGNIVKYSNRPEAHNEIMVARWLKNVRDGDDVLCLGDICMTGKRHEEWFDAVKRLPGNKFLLKGNHDNQTNAWYERKFGITVLPVTRPSRKKNNMQGGHMDVCLQPVDNQDDPPLVVAFSHCPLHYVQSGWDINVHGHIHTNGYPAWALTDRRDYRNVSIEVMNYEPVRLGDIIYGERYQSPAQGGCANTDSRIQ